MAQGSVIPPPSPAACIGPLLPALLPATVSTQPPPGVLPLLTPILRQRVQFLSPDSAKPWIGLLCRDAAKAPRLAEVVDVPGLEPHPSSGEIEVDWDRDVDVVFCRVDEETLEAITALRPLGLVFRLVYCVAEGEAAQAGWRVGEVFADDVLEASSRVGGAVTISEAEQRFQLEHSNPASKTVATTGPVVVNVNNSSNGDNAEDDDDDDDDYWNRYDATPGGRTPAAPRSPAPAMPTSTSSSRPRSSNGLGSAAEDAYFAQYGSVQPAMDPHDPDEGPSVSSPAAAAASEFVSFPPTIDFIQQREEDGNGMRTSVNSANSRRARAGMGSIIEVVEENGQEEGEVERASSDGKANGAAHPGNDSDLHHPRPSSSAGSNRSTVVDRLEGVAEAGARSEMGVRRHIASSIRSLHELALAAGIQGGDFRRLVMEGLEDLGGGEDI